MFIVFSIPILMEPIFHVEEASSQIKEIEDSILKTEVGITSVTADSSTDLLNTGDEKLFEFDEFDLLITYDADIAGTKTRVTEQFTYNDVGFGAPAADFNIQRGITEFGAAEDSISVPINAVNSIGNGGNAFVRLTNAAHSAIVDIDGGEGTRNNDDLGALPDPKPNHH